MSDDEVVEWNIDAVAANPAGFFVETIHEVDNLVFEEIGLIQATIANNVDFSIVRMAIAKEVLLKIEDGEAELKDFIKRLRSSGKKGNFSISGAQLTTQTRLLENTH